MYSPPRRTLRPWILSWFTSVPFDEPRSVRTNSPSGVGSIWQCLREIRSLGIERSACGSRPITFGFPAVTGRSFPRTACGPFTTWSFAVTLPPGFAAGAGRGMAPGVAPAGRGKGMGVAAGGCLTVEGPPGRGMAPGVPLAGRKGAGAPAAGTWTGFLQLGQRPIFPAYSSLTVMDCPHLQLKVIGTVGILYHAGEGGLFAQDLLGFLEPGDPVLEIALVLEVAGEALPQRVEQPGEDLAEVLGGELGREADLLRLDVPEDVGAGGLGPAGRLVDRQELAVLVHDDEVRAVDLGARALAVVGEGAGDD